VTNIAMPGLNGLEAIRRLRVDAPQLRILVLSAHDEPRLVLACIEAGASGYLLKDSGCAELAEAIRDVANGRIHLAQRLVGLFVEQYRARLDGEPLKAAASPLTPRERELVQLFSEGHSTSEIAERLHLSVKTVATHRENILHKLNIRGVAEMTRYALREGLSTL
jgi:DNA-binding NarL/FixJ family response regulator